MDKRLLSKQLMNDFLSILLDQYGFKLKKEIASTQERLVDLVFDLGMETQQEKESNKKLP